jgi:hypothetical protein
MRDLVTSALCLALFLFPAHSKPLSPLRPTVVAQNYAQESTDPTPAEPKRDESPTSAPTPTNPVDIICQTLNSAALVNDLPLEFLTRLIWQESRFDTRAITVAAMQLSCARACVPSAKPVSCSRTETQRASPSAWPGRLWRHKSRDAARSNQCQQFICGRLAHSAGGGINNSREPVADNSAARRAMSLCPRKLPRHSLTGVSAMGQQLP